MNLFNDIKKGVASLTLTALALFLGGPIAQASLGFTDDAIIPSWATEAIEELMDQGVISGNDDGSFAPNRQLNRAEVSKVIVLASGVDIDTAGGPHFPDVAESAWYYDYIETMYNMGWINGYPDGQFRPGVGINRAEIAKMVVNAFEIDQDLSGAPHFDDVSSSDWFYGYVETAYNNGLMRGYGDGTFGPANAVTRAETIKIVYDSQLVVADPVGPAEGTLEVSLSGDTPRGTNVPYNATSVPYTTIEMTASDDSDVEISSLTFTRLGLGDNDDFENVWVEIDGFKVGNDKSINNDDVVELRFNPAVVVPAGQTLVADLVASAKFTSADKNIGHHNRLALVSAEDISSTAANIVGDFPIEGEEMEVADYEVSQLTFTSLGSATNIDVGDNFVEIGKFRMLNSSNTNKDVELRAITFKNDGIGEIEDVLENVGLYVSGEQVSAEAIMDGDYITFRLDNGVTGGYIIEDGDSRIFSIRADIVSAEKNDTIKFKVDNFEDIVGVEIGTSFGIKAVDANGNNAEDAYATLAEYSIDSGDLNVSRDPSSLGNQQYAPGSNDVVVLTARVVVDQPLIVDGITLRVASGSTVLDKTDAGTVIDNLADFNAAFDNFRLFLNDNLIDSENDFTTTVTETTPSTVAGTPTNYRLAFNTTFEIAGTSVLKLVANVQDGAATGDKLKMAFTATDVSSPEYISTGDQVASTELLGSATGSFVEVTSSSVTITRTDGLSDGDRIVSGVDDVTFMKFVMDNNDSGNINVTSITVNADTTPNTTNAGKGVSGSARTYTNFTLAMYVDGLQQGSAKNLSSAGVATFNDLSVVVPSAGQKEFTVVVDTIEDSATAISTTSMYVGNETAVGDTLSLPVVSTAGMTIGDLVTINSTVYAIDGIGTCTVVNGTGSAATTGVVCSGAVYDIDGDGAITATDDGTAPVIDLNADLGANITDGFSAVVKHQIKFDIAAASADNVENGQSVTVNANGAGAIGSGNKLVGVYFVLVQSGQLSVSLDTTVSANILVANQANVDVLKIRFNAADDEVQVKDLYLENSVGGGTAPDEITAGDRVDFRLYDEDGQLLQEKQMTSGTLHFELANQDRIRVPKDESTFVTLKVNVRDISKANQTGKRLLIALDADNTTHAGIEAVTAATGDDITLPAAGWGDVEGQVFVIYRSQLEVRHAAVQPAFQDPTTASQEIYRFTVTADAARQVELGRVSFDVALAGMTTHATNDAVFTVKAVKADGSIDTASTVVSAVTDSFVVGTADASGIVTVDFANQRFSAGESKTYALFMSETINSTTIADDDSVAVTIRQGDTTYAAPANRYDRELTGATITVGGTNNLTATMASVNITIGGETTIAVDGCAAAAAACDSNAELSVAIAAAITANSKYTATGTSGTGTTGVVTITSSAGATSSTINTATMLAAFNATAGVSTVTLTAAKTTTSLIWSDESDTSHSDTTLDWLNGYLVDVDTTSKINAD